MIWEFDWKIKWTKPESQLLNLATEVFYWRFLLFYSALEQLLADRAAKEEEKRKKEEQKRAQAEKKAREEAEKDKIASIPPTEWFKKEEHLKLYTQWNDAGLPTHRKNPER